MTVAMLPCLVIRQESSSQEARAVLTACLLNDIPVRTVDIGLLAGLGQELAAGALPVGSVEFVRAAMSAAGLNEPAPVSYPHEVDHLLGRRVEQMPLGQVRGGYFVKPVMTKQFTGFVWRATTRDSDYDEHDLEQLKVVRSLPRETLVWVANPVSFLSEWRYYVLGNQVLGSARYDQVGADDAPEPDRMVLGEATRAIGATNDPMTAYAVDLGVLADGRTVIVEVNDAWAIGLYGRSVSATDYVRFLSARWNQIVRGDVQ